MNKQAKLLAGLGYEPHKFNINSRARRINGQNQIIVLSDYTSIVAKPNNSGLEVHVRDDAPLEVIDLPVLITKAGFKEKVRNDFYIGKRAKVIILAACGICNDGCLESLHQGQHNINLANDAKLHYIEKHYGSGRGEKNISPSTRLRLGPNAEITIESSQIAGIEQAKRSCHAELGEGAKLIINERIVTTGQQQASTSFVSQIRAKHASLKISSRSIASEQSRQWFSSNISGETECFAHIECDAIIKDRAQVSAKPEILARHPESNLIHEAAIGKIAKDQLIKLMSLGYSQKQAEKIIIDGFLK